MSAFPRFGPDAGQPGGPLGTGTSMTPGAGSNDTGTAPISNYVASAPSMTSYGGYGQQIGQTFAGENALAASLAAQANGTGGPNLGEQLLRQATNQNIQSQAGAVASLRGLSPAAQQRLIALNSAGIQQQSAGQAATERMQEQLAAQAQLGALYGQQGQQAIGGNSQQNLAAMEGQRINAGTATANEQAQSEFQRQQEQWHAALLGPVTAGIGGASQGAGSAIAGGSMGGGGAAGAAAAAAAHGAIVPGRKQFPGDDPRNDKKPYLLSPGEVVVPASIADDPIAAAMYVARMRRRRKAA